MIVARIYKYKSLVREESLIWGLLSGHLADVCKDRQGEGDADDGVEN